MKKPNRNPCSVDGCGRPRWSLGYCGMHLRRVKLYGDSAAVHRPFELKGRMPDEERKRRESDRNKRRYQAHHAARLERAAAYRHKVGPDVLRQRWRERYRKDPTPFKRSARNRKYRVRAAFVESIEPAVVYERSKGVCGICGEAVTRERMHIDHIIPISRGGLHCYDNVQAAHPKCNRAKSDKWEPAL